MNLNSENKQAIHEVLIADMQQRLHEDSPPNYGIALETLVEDILHTNSIKDICVMLHSYDELFPSEYLTIDGTLNYVLQLLCNKIHAYENEKINNKS